MNAESFAVLLSSASLDTTGPELVIGVCSSFVEAAATAATIRRAQPGIRTWTMSRNPGEPWRQVWGDFATAPELLATLAR